MLLASGLVSPKKGADKGSEQDINPKTHNIAQFDNHYLSDERARHNSAIKDNTGIIMVLKTNNKTSGVPS